MHRLQFILGKTANKCVSVSASTRCSSWRLPWFCWLPCCSSVRWPRPSQSWLLSAQLTAWCSAPRSPSTSPCWLRSWGSTGLAAHWGSSCSFAAAEACSDHPLLVGEKDALIPQVHAVLTLHITQKWISALSCCCKIPYDLLHRANRLAARNKH